MNAEIIAVGSELLTPQRIDTNSLYLTDQLNALGVEVVAKHVVGDDRARLAEIIRLVLRRSEILVLSGGLGPTEDDVTRDAVALALDRGQEFRQDLFEAIERRSRRLNRPMPDINRRQAYLIDGAEPLPNPNGTAAGQWIQEDGRVLMLLPGPPNELKPLFRIECVPRLQAMLPAQVIRSRVFRVALMPESELDQRIAPVYTRYTNPATTVLAGFGDIQVHLRARCGTEAEAEALLAEVAGPIEQLLGDRIYSRNGEPLEATVGALLRRRQVTLSVAESCTGGMLAEHITAVPGSSDYFRGGFLVYTDAMKTSLLGVDPALLKEHTAVSEPAATAMAVGAKQRTGSNFALSVTGVAGPDGGTEATPVGTVFIGLADESNSTARRFQFLGDRARVRTLATQTALDLLRKRLG